MAFVFTPDMTRPIKLENGQYLGELPKTPDIFLNRSCIYYGASGSGKTIAIQEELYLLKDIVERVTVFCPTNDLNNTYTGIVPQVVIHQKLTQSAVAKIYEEQKLIAEIYAKVNSSAGLAPLIEGLKKTEPNAYFAVTRSVLEYRESANLHKKASTDPTIDEKLESAIVGAYRSVLLKYKKKLLQDHIEDPYYLLLYHLELNPRLLLIFDDCIEEIAALSKVRSRETEPCVIDSFFTRGRHMQITIIVAAQDDNKVTTTMRKNSFLSIFTESECAKHFMESKANAIMPAKKKIAEFACREIYGKGMDNRKLVYNRAGNSAETWFCYSLANRYGNFRVGSNLFWEVCKEITNKSKNNQDDFLVSLKKFTGV